MLLQKEIKRIFQTLIYQKIAHTEIMGLDIVIRILDNANKLSLSTVVYSGESYIPKSVRACLSHQLPLANRRIKTYLQLNEENFQITLYYLNRLEGFDDGVFQELLEEFASQASLWRDHLDEHDRNDLIHVHFR